jgi:hypothetical protein
MQNTSGQVAAAGFPEMWQPVYQRYKQFFDCAGKLQPIVSKMITTPIEGHLQQMVGHMVAAAANTYGALLTLVLNGFGHEAMKLARSLFEVELNILRLKLHPDELADYLDYNLIQQKQLYDVLSDEQKQLFSSSRYDEMMSAYNSVLGRFATGRDKARPRNEWCRESLYERAKEAGPEHLDLYRIFYRQASSLHHLDIAGIIHQLDDGLFANMAPSWASLDDALVATGSFIRSIAIFDELANLGLKEQLENGPVADYLAACKSLNAEISESPLNPTGAAP